MIVQCPKCKTKLKVDETRIKPEGSRMKCPRCTVVLMVRRPQQRPAPPAPPQQRPAPPPQRPAQAAPVQPRPAAAPAPEAARPAPAPPGSASIPPGTKVLVAHGDSSTLNEAVGILMGAGCAVSTAPDGVEAMVKAQQEEPDVALIDVALPKIYGFEVAKRLRSQESTANTRVVLITSVHKEDRYRREPADLYGADGFVEEPNLRQKLLSEVSAVLAKSREKQPPPAAAPPPREEPSSPAAAGAVSSQDRERAQRLSRTILSDIELYSPDKVVEAIRAGTFEAVFADELSEGRKLYDARVGDAVKAEQDYFREAVRVFIQKKEEQFGTT